MGARKKMGKPPFSNPSQDWLDAEFTPISVFLAGELQSGKRFGGCVVRRIAPERVTLKTSVRVKPGDPVRVDLYRERHLLGKVEDCQDKLVVVHLQHVPPWILELVIMRSAD